MERTRAGTRRWPARQRSATPRTVTVDHSHWAPPTTRTATIHGTTITAHDHGPHESGWPIIVAVRHPGRPGAPSSASLNATGVRHSADLGDARSLQELRRARTRPVVIDGLPDRATAPRRGDRRRRQRPKAYAIDAGDGAVADGGGAAGEEAATPPRPRAGIRRLRLRAGPDAGRRLRLLLPVRSTHAEPELGKLAAVARQSSRPATRWRSRSASRSTSAQAPRSSGSPNATQLAPWRPHVPREQVLPRRTCTRRSIVRGIAHPIAKAAYWVNQNVIDGIVNGVGESGKRTGEWVYATSTSAWSTVRSTPRASSPPRAATPCNPSSPARSTSTARCCSAPPPSAPSSSSSTQRLNSNDRACFEARAIMETSPTTTGSSALGTFLPLRRRAGDACSSRPATSARTSMIAIVTAGSHARRRHLHAGPVRLRRSPRSCSSASTRVDRGDQVELHDRARRHQPAAVLPVDGRHVPGGDLHLGQHARRRQPEGVPDR